MTNPPVHADVLVVGAGPAGSAAAAWAARGGAEVVLADAAVFPRDKTCGDGLTPRAVGELQLLGLDDWLRAHAVNQGLRAHGFGQTLLLPWPGGTLPSWGSAVARTELDDHLRTTAIKAGATAIDGARAVDVRREGGRVAGVVFKTDDGPLEIGCRNLVVADGVRSPLGKVLGREWHRDTVYGVAGRSYVASGMSDDPWISSHLELRDEAGKVLSGYGWIFPLGTGDVNIGVGTLATSKRPADLAVKPLMAHYAELRREEFELSGELRMPTSALLPMGGAVSNVAGPNWALIGDAAACVNPLNGEGIDYGLETGRLVADMIAAGEDLATAWPALLREHYGEAFSIARRLGGLVTIPHLLSTLGPAGMRSDWLMTLALRWMGNLVTDEDRDRAARVWRWAGRRSIARDARPPFA
ncbi:MAG: menaquinone-9 beta-reductase [Nocardioidaceae bacterium]|nr:menaquinone-9 beta-reductase [Nocardioidaceae bacterium]